MSVNVSGVYKPGAVGFGDRKIQQSQRNAKIGVNVSGLAGWFFIPQSKLGVRDDGLHGRRCSDICCGGAMHAVVELEAF